MKRKQLGSMTQAMLNNYIKNIMDVKKAIDSRRAYRSLEQVKITKKIVDNLSRCAQLSASCFNNQPWRFVFVYEPEVLKKCMMY